jgi:hypothetical protein
MIEFDWRNPDYAAVFRARMENLDALRAHPEELPALKRYYRDNQADFISDWGVTYNPRNVEIGLPTLLPFILFPKQREWIDWVLARWRAGEPGLCEKSRDMGVSWEAIALSCALCIFYEGMSIGFGSRKSEYVDHRGDLKSLLPKARMFVSNLPEEFRAGFVEWRDSPLMRINFPETGSVIGGEGGDDIGRGDRRSIYFVDEFAHFERGDLVEASLSQTTNCRIDMSSVRGMNNPFAKKRWGGKVNVFIFDWRDDPRKDEAWYEKQCAELDPVVVAQEIDRDYSASVHGILIPGAWVRAAIDAKTKLGIAPSGARGMALDVADEGADKDAACCAEGTEIISSEEWSGKGSDIYSTVIRAFQICDDRGYDGFRYDADGLGAGVRGDARVINEGRRANGLQPLNVVGFRGSEGVFDPDGIVDGTIGREGDRGRTNQDYFANRKAQSWWGLRKRFQKTYRWIVEGIACPPDDIISINPKCPNHMKLVAELSQPTYTTNGVGKILVNKKPDGMKSPNIADAVMIRFALIGAPQIQITHEMLAQVMRAAPRRRF